MKKLVELSKGTFEISDVKKEMCDNYKKLYMNFKGKDDDYVLNVNKPIWAYADDLYFTVETFTYNKKGDVVTVEEHYLKDVFCESDEEIVEAKLTQMFKEAFVENFPLQKEKEFNDMTPKEATDYLSKYLMDIDCDDERCSDAIKRLQMLVNDLMQ